MKPKCCPTPTSVSQRHPAADQVDDPAAEGEPEPGAFLARGPAPALLKGLEDPFLVLGGMPMPVSATVTVEPVLGVGAAWTATCRRPA